MSDLRNDSSNDASALYVDIVALRDAAIRLVVAHDPHSVAPSNTLELATALDSLRARLDEGGEALFRAARALLLALDPPGPAPVPRTPAELAVAIEQLRTSLLPAGHEAWERLRARVFPESEPTPADSFASLFAGGEMDVVALGFAALCEVNRRYLGIVAREEFAPGPRESELLGYIDASDATKDEVPRG